MAQGSQLSPVGLEKQRAEKVLKLYEALEAYRRELSRLGNAYSIRIVVKYDQPGYGQKDMEFHFNPSYDATLPVGILVVLRRVVIARRDDVIRQLNQLGAPIPSEETK